MELKYAAFAALLFYVMSNPLTYMLVGSLMSDLSHDGRPTGMGLIVQSVLFGLVVAVLMML
jgi:hypothetical protein